MSAYQEFKKSQLVAEVAGCLEITPDHFAQFLVSAYPGAEFIQLLSYLLRCKKYKLDPIAKEIVALRDDFGRYEPYVTYDGWLRIMNNHPQFNGMKIRYAETCSKELHAVAQCHDWMECVIERKDRGKPTIVREYLDECYQAPSLTEAGDPIQGPWQLYPKRRLRQKTTMEGVRAAFGISDLRITLEMGDQRLVSAGGTPELTVVRSSRNLDGIVPTPAVQPEPQSSVLPLDDTETAYAPSSDVVLAVESVIARSKQFNAPQVGMQLATEMFSGSELEFALAKIREAFPSIEPDAPDSGENSIAEEPESDSDQPNESTSVVRASLPSVSQF